MSEGLDIEAIEARLNAATPGPWCAEMDADKKATARDWREVWAGSNAVVVADGYERHSAGETEAVYGVRIRAANADLIAHAPEDLRVLLAEVRRLAPSCPCGARNPEHANAVHDERCAYASALAEADRNAALLAQARAEVRRLTGERDEARAALQSAREALAPFAEMAEHLEHPESPDSTIIVMRRRRGHPERHIVLGAFRAARAVIDPAAVAGGGS